MRVLFAPAGWRAEQTEGPLRAAGVEVNTVHFRPPAKLARLSLAGRTLATTLFARADILLCDMCSSLAMLPLAPALLRRWPLVLRPHSDLWREAQDMRMQGRGGLVRNLLDPGLQNWFYRRVWRPKQRRRRPSPPPFPAERLRSAPRASPRLGST
ncbi:unnamed protein product [marine sediment metagenome]|uniref:Uncharacterized protein n=1 Tax=marine sediment metagenome TaxID=412755 RepID=X1F448_9ZZZZ